MKSPFRRRRKGHKGRLAAAHRKPAGAKTPEAVDWPTNGTGRPSMMGAIRGDGETGAGFGAGMFEELHAAFSGAKKIQLEEQEAEKLRRGDDHHVEGDPRDSLDSGRIRIRRRDSDRSAQEADGPAAPAPEAADRTEDDKPGHQ